MLRVLLMSGKLKGTWIAVSLEHYIAAQGNSHRDAIREFTAMLGSEVAYGAEHGDPRQPLAHIEPAPNKYWRKFEKAKPYEPPKMEVRFTIEPHREEIHVPAVEQYRLAA